MVKTIRSTFEEELNQGKMSTTRNWTRYLAALFIFVNDLADFVCDWLFFVDVTLMEPGLVYGPPSTSVWAFILLFSVIGTVFFVMETVYLYYETRHDDASVKSDILSLIVVWVEDVPQVIISLYLVLCREEAISIFQMVKAIVILVGTLIRLIQVGVKYFHEKKKGQGRQKHHWKIKIVIFIGMFFQALAACLVFGLSYAAPKDSGIFFKVPSTLIEETVDDTKYFTNVSVFVNHAEHFDVGGLKVAQALASGDGPVVNWMRLDSINSIMGEGGGDGVRFRLEFEQSPSTGILKLAWWKKPKGEDATSPTWTPIGCYIINQTEGTISNVRAFSDCTRGNGSFTRNSTNVYMTFGYTPPGVFFMRQMLGDVTLNMRVERIESGHVTCQEVDGYTSSLSDSPDPAMPLRFNYFQTGSHFPPQGQSHFLKDKNSNGNDRLRFFHNDGKDLTEIGEVWKTGWLSCESQGHLAPTMNKNLRVFCSKN